MVISLNKVSHVLNGSSPNKLRQKGKGDFGENDPVFCQQITQGH